MANVILFGPPGVGKSTLIGILKTKGFSAIDLEDLYPNRIRYQVPNLVRNAFIGAADLNPKRRYPSGVKVLLYADPKHYDNRRARRDRVKPEKASQDHHDMYKWWKDTQWDYVIDTSHLGPQATAEALTSFFEEVNKA